MLRSSLSLVLSLFATAALAQGDIELLLVNGTDYAIVELALSPPNIDYWGHNFLLPPALQGGEARRVKLKPFAAECTQDVRGAFAEDRSQVIWRGLNVCNVKKLTLFFHRGSGRAYAAYE
jgi:hypothetical protein